MRSLAKVVGVGAVLAVLLAGSPSVRADVIYDNFGPGDSYTTNTGWTIGGPAGTTFWEQGDPFTPSNTYTLTQFTMAGSNVLGTDVYAVLLMDDAGGLPGNIIETYFFGGLAVFGNNNPPLVGVSALNPTLQAGQQYWLIAITRHNTWSVWNWNSTGDNGVHAQRQDLGAWYTINNTRGAYRIEGDLVTAASGTKPVPAAPKTDKTDPVDPSSVTDIDF